MAPSMDVRYFACVVPGVDLNIRLNLNVVDGLGAAVMEGFKAVPRRGLEVGGLLLGRVEPGCVIVDAFQAVPSEHQRGPSWALSDNDKRLLAQAVARGNNSEDGTQVVGLYRSQTRPGFALCDDDAAMLQEHCGAKPSVFLLVKPEALSRSVALFAAGAGLHATSEVFPFRGKPVAALPAPPPPTAPRVLQPVPRLQTARVLEGFAADKERPPATTSGVGRLVALLAWPLVVLLCAAVGGYGLARWWTSPPPAEASVPSTMALHVTWTGSSLDLRWDRHSQSIRRANGAVLTIDDGEQHRRLELGLDDLTQGSIQYWPTSNDVAFRLDVFTSDATDSESVRVVNIPIPPRPPSAEAKPADMTEPIPPKSSRRTEPRHRGSAARATPR